MTVKYKGGRPTKDQAKILESLKKEFLKVLADNDGWIVSTCRKVDIGLDTYYKWRRDDKEFRVSCNKVNAYVAEVVARKLLNVGHKSDNINAYFHYLRHKGYLIGMGEKGGRVLYEGPPLKTDTTKEITMSMNNVISEFENGNLSADETQSLMTTLEDKRKALQGDYEERLKALEEKANKAK